MFQKRKTIYRVFDYVKNALFQVIESLTSNGLNMQGVSLSHLKLLQLGNYKDGFSYSLGTASEYDFYTLQFCFSSSCLSPSCQRTTAMLSNLYQHSYQKEKGDATPVTSPFLPGKAHVLTVDFYVTFH